MLTAATSNTGVFGGWRFSGRGFSGLGVLGGRGFSGAVFLKRFCVGAWVLWGGFFGAWCFEAGFVWGVLFGLGRFLLGAFYFVGQLLLGPGCMLTRSSLGRFFFVWVFVTRSSR